MNNEHLVALPDLIGLAQAGDRDAIADLLQRTQPDIRRYARRACRLEDVDDAVQEALDVVSRRIASLRQPAALVSWLFVMVQRECYRLARAGRFAWHSIDGLENSLELASRPEAELRLDLAGAVQSLPAHYRQIVLLRDVEELTIAEIGVRTGLSRETVKARLHRARKLLREYLAR